MILKDLSWGATAPRILFISGVPSRIDVKDGKILSGTDGALLRRVLASMKVDLFNDIGYMSVFDNNSVGSEPKIDKIRAAMPGLMKRMSEYDPGVIVTLGDVATTAVLGSGASSDRRRGFCEEINGKVVLPSRNLFSIIANPDEFPDLLTDMQRALLISEGGEHTIDPPYEDYKLIDSEETFESLIESLRDLQGCPVALDIETTSLEPKSGRLLSLGLSWRRNSGHCVDCQWMDSDPSRTVILKKILAGMKHIFHNAQFDVAWLRHRGFTINLEFDTMLAHYLLDGRQSGHGLKRLAADRYYAPAYDDAIDVKTLNMGSWIMLEEYRHAVMKYNCADADYTFRLYEDLLVEMREDGVNWVHDNIMLPASIHFIRLRENGMQVDREYHDSLGAKWLKEIEALELEMKKFSGAENLNLRSTKQVKEYLYDTLGLRPMGGRKNAPVSAKLVSREISEIEDAEAQEFWRTSNVSKDLKSSSTGTYMLYYLAQQHEFPRILVKHRILSKLHGTYYEGYRELMDAEGKIRPSYKLHGTRTGRISSTKPNIHGMPRRKEIKSIFNANDGYVIISADYSQAEIRMVAHLAEDETLTAALDAQDIHKEISKTMFSMTDADVEALPAEEREIKRRAAKTIAFGLIYGRSAASIAPQLNITKEEATEYMNKFFEMMPRVAKWLAEQKRRALRDHEVSSIYGRKRRFPLIASQSHKAEVQRQAGNMPVQSSVSDMTLLANMRIIRVLEAEGIECLIFPHVHDGFYFQVQAEYENRAVEVTRSEMHKVGFKTKVNFKCEIQTGTNWGRLKIVYNG